jgi:hypothetical protein
VGVETRRLSRESVLEAVRQHQDATANARMERTTNLRPDTITFVQRHAEGTATGVDQLMAEGELLGDDPVAAPPPMEPGQTVRATLPLRPARPQPLALSPPPRRGALWGARAPLMAAAALFLLAFGLGATFLLWQALFGMGEPAAEVEAPRVGAQIQVDSSPSGAQILIDGIKQRELTPARIGGLTPGPHTLTLAWEGREVHSQDFTLTTDTALNFFADLQPQLAAQAPGVAGEADAGPAGSPDAAAAPDVDEIWITEGDPEPARPAEEEDKGATLLLMATPQASVEVDGEPLPDQAGPEAPLEITPLQRGRVYKIKVQRRGYETQELSVRMDQARVEEHVRLKRKQEFGYLTLTSTPWAEVFIDNKRVASSTPLRAHRLPVGTHTVTLKNPAQKLQKSLQVEIKPNETIQRRIQL